MPFDDQGNYISPSVDWLQSRANARQMTPDEVANRASAQKIESMPVPVAPTTSSGSEPSLWEAINDSNKFAQKFPGFTSFMQNLTAPIHNFQDNTAVGKGITRFGRDAGAIATGGASEMNRDDALPSTGNSLIDKAIDFGSFIPGVAVNPGGIGSLNSVMGASGGVAKTGYDALTAGLKPATALGKTALNLGGRFAEGVGSSIPYSIQEQLGQPDKPFSDRLADIASNAAMFGGMDAGLSLLGQGIRAGVNAIKNRNITLPNEPLTVPPYNAMSNQTPGFNMPNDAFLPGPKPLQLNPSTSGVLLNPANYKDLYLPRPWDLPTQTRDFSTTTEVPPVKPSEPLQLNGNTLDTRLLPDAEARLQPYIEAEYQQLKAIRDNPPKPLDRGGLIQDDEGYVQGAYGTSSAKPDWLLNFERQNNRRKPNNAELMQIARDHVLNGEKDSRFGDIPNLQGQIESNINDLVERMSTDKDPNVLASYQDQLDQLEKQYHELQNGTYFAPGKAPRTNVEPVKIAKGKEIPQFPKEQPKEPDINVPSGPQPKVEPIQISKEANQRIEKIATLSNQPKEVVENMYRYLHHLVGEDSANYLLDHALEQAPKVEPKAEIKEEPKNEPTVEKYLNLNGSPIKRGERLLDKNGVKHIVNDFNDEGITLTNNKTGETKTIPLKEAKQFSLGEKAKPKSETAKQDKSAKQTSSFQTIKASKPIEELTQRDLQKIKDHLQKKLDNLEASAKEKNISNRSDVVNQRKALKNDMKKADVLSNKKSAPKTEPKTTKEQTPKNEPKEQAPKEGEQHSRGSSPLPKGNNGAKPITRKEIIDNLKKNLGVPIRTGRLGVADPAVKGLFKIKPEVIRSRMDKDISVIAHEVGHFLDKKHNLSDAKFDQELLPLGQKTSGKNYTTDQIRKEGIAEFTRLFLTDRQAAEKAAPSFFQEFMNKVPGKILKGLDGTREDIARWINQSAPERFRGKVNRDTRSISDRAKDFMKKNLNYTQLVDNRRPFETAEREINKMSGNTEAKYLGLFGKKGKLNSAEDSVYKMSRLYAGTPRVAENYIHHNLEPIMKGLKKLEHNTADLGDYAAAIHARELEAQGIETGFTKEEIDHTIVKYKSPEMDVAQKKLVQYSNKLLDMLVKSGRISQESVDAMKQKYPDYVPFFRFFDEDMNGGQGVGKGFANVTNPIKRMKGSTKDIVDPIEGLVKNTFAVVQAANKNEVGLQLLKLSEREGAGKFAEVVPGADSAKENVLTVYKNGEPVHLQLDPELYRATREMDKEVSNSLIKILSYPASALRAGATLTPEFILRNPIRDQFHAYIVSKYGYNPVIDLPKGVYHLFKKGTGIYDQWIEEGGAHGQYVSQDRNLIQKELKKIQGNPSKLKALNIINPKQWMEVLRRFSEISEEATKVGVFNKALKKGVSPAEAAFESRDIMDFSRKGNSIDQANRVISFLNANIQGKDKLVRAFNANPIRSTIRAAASITLPTVGLYWWNNHMLNDEQKKAYDNIPQWQKDMFFIVHIPGTNEFARIPKPQDIGPVFSNAVEQMLRYVQNNNPESWSDFANSMYQNAIALPAMLTGLTPWIENMTNHSFFTDGQIVPERDMDLMPKDQYGATTSLTAKNLGKMINYSPYKIDNLIRGYGAGLGKYATSGLDTLQQMIGAGQKPTDPAKKWTELPLINAFTVNQSGGGKVMNDFYNDITNLKQEFNSAKKNHEPLQDASMFKMMNKIGLDISKVRAVYRAIQSDTQMSPDDKRAKLDKLDNIMNNLAGQAVKAYNKK